jgi:hypothetical protein
MGRPVNVGRTSPHSASARGSWQLGHQLACAELSGLAEPGVARRNPRCSVVEMPVKQRSVTRKVSRNWRRCSGMFLS